MISPQSMPVNIRSNDSEHICLEEASFVRAGMVSAMFLADERAQKPSAGCHAGANKRPMRSKYANGFSLIELILVLALISILFSMVAPRLGGTLGHVTLKSCARDVAMTLNFAHYSAVHNGINYRVNYDLDDNAYWVSSESERFVYNPIAERWGNRKILPSGISFRDVTSMREIEKSEGTEYTNFSPYGNSEKCMLHIVNAKNDVFTIVVSKALSKVRVLDYDFKFAQ